MGVKKPRLSFWQIWNMSFGFLGIQMGFALQNANVSRIFETLGASKDDIPGLWLAAPVTGLLVQPIIGYLSDRTWHPTFGRRRPYFLVGAILASLALLYMPNSPHLWVAAGMLWIMDASINISMEPFRAFVGDMLPSEQRTRGFAMQSFFIGVGAVIASMLPWMLTNWLGVSNTAEAGIVPPSVKWAFYIGGGAFFIAVLWTVIKTKEYPPDEVYIKEDNEPLVIKFTPAFYGNVGLFLLAIAGLSAYGFYYSDVKKELYVLSGIFALFGFSYFFASLFMSVNRYRNGFVQIVRDFQNMPKTMVQLAVVQFFSWFALFAMWIYSTAGVTSHIYDMKVNSSEFEEMKGVVFTLKDQQKAADFKNFSKIEAEIDDYERQFLSGQSQVVVSMRIVNFFIEDKNNIISEGLNSTMLSIQREYNKGADWVGVCFAIYNGIAAIFALLLPYIAKKYSRRIAHLISLTAGGLGLISIFFVTDPIYLLVSMVGVGIGWASILSIPYAMLAGCLPANKMGYYMGIFNFFIVIPQIVAASILGFLVSTVFSGNTIYSLILGGCCMIFAGILTLRVDDRDDIRLPIEHE
jgi:maltose/moltooligosaccharide transporter